MKRMLLLLLLTSCASGFVANEQKINNIALQYGPAWKEEHIDNSMSPLVTIDQHMQDLLAMKQHLPEEERNQTLLFIDARLNMLLSEKYFQQARVLDPRPLTEIIITPETTLVNADIEQFSCDNVNNTIQATSLLQLSLNKAHEAINELDFLMQNNPDLRDIIGIKLAGVDNRPRFYQSKLGKVWITIRVNQLLIQQCK